MKINDVITEAAGKASFANPQLGMMGKFGKGVLGVASALGSEKANQSLRQLNQQQKTAQASAQGAEAAKQATARAAEEAKKFMKLINIAKDRAIRQGNQISTSELGAMIPKAGAGADPEIRRQMLTRLSDTLTQQYNVQVTGRKRPAPAAPAPAPAPAAPAPAPAAPAPTPAAPAPTPAPAPTNTVPNWVTVGGRKVNLNDPANAGMAKTFSTQGVTSPAAPAPAAPTPAAPAVDKTTQAMADLEKTMSPPELSALADELMKKYKAQTTT